jgi:hypothetical protein
MNDARKTWKDAEEEIKTAIAWRDKWALYYAEYALKYYQLKNKIDGK